MEIWELIRSQATRKQMKQLVLGTHEIIDGKVVPKGAKSNLFEKRIAQDILARHEKRVHDAVFGRFTLPSYPSFKATFNLYDNTPTGMDMYVLSRIPENIDLRKSDLVQIGAMKALVAGVLNTEAWLEPVNVLLPPNGPVEVLVLERGGTEPEAEPEPETETENDHSWVERGRAWLDKHRDELWGATEPQPEPKPDPYIVVETPKSVHVIPESVFEKVIDGRMPIMDLSYWQELVRQIVSEWLAGLKAKAEKQGYSIVANASDFPDAPGLDQAFADVRERAFEEGFKAGLDKGKKKGNGTKCRQSYRRGWTDSAEKFDEHVKYAYQRGYRDGNFDGKRGIDGSPRPDGLPTEPVQSGQETAKKTAPCSYISDKLSEMEAHLKTTRISSADFCRVMGAYNYALDVIHRTYGVPGSSLVLSENEMDARIRVMRSYLDGRGIDYALVRDVMKVYEAALSKEYAATGKPISHHTISERATLSGRQVVLIRHFEQYPYPLLESVENATKCAIKTLLYPFAAGKPRYVCVETIQIEDVKKA